jgi:hypothetical protein
MLRRISSGISEFRRPVIRLRGAFVLQAEPIRKVSMISVEQRHANTTNLFQELAGRCFREMGMRFFDHSRFGWLNGEYPFCQPVCRTKASSTSPRSRNTNSAVHRSRNDGRERSDRLKPGTSVSVNAAVTKKQILLKIISIKGAEIVEKQRSAPFRPETRLIILLIGQQWMDRAAIRR